METPAQDQVQQIEVQQIEVQQIEVQQFQVDLPQIKLQVPPPPPLQVPVIQVTEPVSAPQVPVVQAPEPSKVQVPALVSYDSLDTMYNKMILNSALLSTIHTLKNDGFNNASIPLLILTMMATYNSYTNATPANRLTLEDIQILLERVYNYLVDKYDLIDVQHRLAMYNLFNVSLKLCLAIPNVKKEVNSCLNFFKCGRK